MNRRRFLAGLVLTALAPPPAWASQTRRGEYTADVAILYRTFTLALAGTIDEVVDRAAGRYRATIVGDGTRISARLESQGMLRDGRWWPTRSASWFQVVGREMRTEIAWDYPGRAVQYRYRGETFLMRRLRQAEDVVGLPAGTVDDAVSATLNYADGRWTPDADGVFRTHAVRRRRPPGEGTDDVQRFYRAEIVPVTLKVADDPETGKPTALFDLTPFSSWAREDRPARVVFGADRRPELIASSLALGTSVTIRARSVGIGPS